MRQHLEAVLFEDRAARASRVHGDVADAAVVGFPQPGRKKGGVEPATAELGHGRTAPQAGEGPGSGEPDPAAGSWGIASPPGGGGAWWPAELGMPAASGAQNAMRYAYFPAQRRLAIAVHEHVWLYDTLDHQVSGVSQQQGPGSTVTFTSQHGVVVQTCTRWRPTGARLNMV